MTCRLNPLIAPQSTSATVALYRPLGESASSKVVVWHIDGVNKANGDGSMSTARTSAPEKEQPLQLRDRVPFSRSEGDRGVSRLARSPMQKLRGCRRIAPDRTARLGKGGQ